MPRKPVWRTIPDRCVRTIWICPVCRREYRVGPDEATIPYCPEDGCNEAETEYVRTEVRT